MNSASAAVAGVRSPEPSPYVSVRAADAPPNVPPTAPPAPPRRVDDRHVPVRVRTVRRRSLTPDAATAPPRGHPTGLLPATDVLAPYDVVETRDNCA
ncbi:hypothetical protein GCM10018987_65750 [Streptomyces cremeus]